MKVREWQTLGGQWVERQYTDDEILELFPDDKGSLVYPLLRRAQAAEQEIQRLRAALQQVADMAYESITTDDLRRVVDEAARAVGGGDG